MGRGAEGQLPEDTVLTACGHLRLHAGQKYNDRHKLLDPKDFRFLWVVDFPMFEWDAKKIAGTRASSVHLGTRRRPSTSLTTDPARRRAKSYDIVFNGTELGSGSIRIHRRDVQSKVFAALGFSEMKAPSSGSASYLRDSTDGAPPHGGSRWASTVW